MKPLFIILFFLLIFESIHFAHSQALSDKLFGHADLHHAMAVSVVGHSVGSGNYCFRCSNARTSSGFAIFWKVPSVLIGGTRIWVEGAPSDFNNYVLVKATGISVNGKLLRGWLHFTFNIIATGSKSMDPFYALYATIEDTDPRTLNTPKSTFDIPRPDVKNVMGEMTMELMEHCKLPGGGEIPSEMRPTQSMMLPAHGTPIHQQINPITFAYLMSAKIGVGNGGANNTFELHVNWKAPPSNLCSWPEKLFVRVVALGKEGTQTPETCTPDILCQPLTVHQWWFWILPTNLPDSFFMNTDGYPPFATNVNCQVPLGPTPAGANVNIVTMHQNDLGEFLMSEPNPQMCGTNADLAGYRSHNANATFPLYLGRCISRELNARGEHSDWYRPGVSEGNPSLGIRCLSENRFKATFGNQTFVTVEKYLEDLHIDICEIECGHSITELGGSLNVAAAQVPGVDKDYPDGQGPSPLSRDLPSIQFRNIFRNTDGQATPPSNATILLTLQERRANYLWGGVFFHGIFCTVAVLFLIPIVNFCARYQKESFGWLTIFQSETWYMIHVLGVAGIFFCFFNAWTLIRVARFYINQNDLPQTSIHAMAGMITIGLYIILATTGGIRYHRENSLTALKCSIASHALLGYAFYLIGLITMIIIPVQFEDGSGNGGIFHEQALILIAIVGGWFLVDCIFHGIMIFLSVKENKKMGISRSHFVVVQLIIEGRRAPGAWLRKVLFLAYAILSLIFVLAYIAAMTVYLPKNLNFSNGTRPLPSEIGGLSRDNRH